MVVFLELFSIACFWDAFAVVHFQSSNDSSQWNVNFVRAVPD
jgi:hypothetical protein